MKHWSKARVKSSRKNSTSCSSILDIKGLGSFLKTFLTTTHLPLLCWFHTLSVAILRTTYGISSIFGSPTQSGLYFQNQSFIQQSLWACMQGLLCPSQWLWLSLTTGEESESPLLRCPSDVQPRTMRPNQLCSIAFLG